MVDRTLDDAEARPTTHTAVDAGRPPDWTDRVPDLLAGYLAFVATFCAVTALLPVLREPLEWLRTAIEIVSVGAPPSLATAAFLAILAGAVRRRMRAAWWFVVLYLVPFIKYPANPPSVGDPDTITKRTALYLIMILISLLAAIAAVRLRKVLSERWSGTTATLVAGFGFLLVVVVAGALLPPINEVPKTFPAVTLFRFREASLGMQLVIWTTIGLVFAATAERVMTGRTILPRRKSNAPVPAVD